MSNMTHIKTTKDREHVSTIKTKRSHTTGSLSARLKSLRNNNTRTPEIMRHPNNYRRLVQSAPEKKSIHARTQEIEKENIDLQNSSAIDKQQNFQRAELTPPSNNKTPLQENESSSQLSHLKRGKPLKFYGRHSTIKGIPLGIVKASSTKHLRESVTPTTPVAWRHLRQSSLSSAFHGCEVSSRGFANLGNTCYMNVILQSILNLGPFIQDLENHIILNNVDELSLCNCMYNLYLCKHDDSSSSRKGKALKQLKKSVSTTEMTKRFSGNLQNDAHEFMNVCLDQIQEEVQAILKEKSEESIAEICPVVRNFQGSLRKYIICKGCKDLTTKDECFNHLSLNFPTSDSSTTYSWENLFTSFFQPEELERSCCRCHCTTAVQHLKITRLPRILILHVLRSQYQHGVQRKNSDSIRVTQYIQLGGFCSSDITGPLSFEPKERRVVKPCFAENETPANGFVASKPRRRLDMSAAEYSSLSDKKAEKRASFSQKNYPDWIKNSKPVLHYFDDLGDDEEMENAKLASLEKRSLNEDDELERAKEESLKLKSIQRRLDLKEEEQIQQALKESLDTKEQETRNSDKRFARKRSSLHRDDSLTGSPAKLFGGTNKFSGRKTRSKRRKIERTPIDFESYSDEDAQMKKALDLSRNEYNLRQSEQDHMELTDMEKAIRLSLGDDTSVNTSFGDMNVDESVSRTEIDDRRNAPSSESSYRLMSIVCHVGSSANVGHYICYGFDTELGQWNKYNDTSVEKVSENLARNDKFSDGYVYFYMHKSCSDKLREKTKIS